MYTNIALLQTPEHPQAWGGLAVSHPASPLTQVTVKMYKRGGQAWLGRPLSGTATIPSSTHVLFRVSGEDSDSRIPATRIHTISLSI